MSITRFPPAIVARTTLFESDASVIVPDSDIVWEGIFAVAEVTSRLLPEICTAKDEFFAASLINILLPHLTQLG